MKKIISFIIGLTLVFSLTGCGITIVPLDDEAKAEGGNDVAAFWESQAVPEIEENAVDLVTLLDEANGNIKSLVNVYGRYSNGESGNILFPIHGIGKVKEVNTEKKAGYLTVELDGYTGNTVICVQIGPVFKETTMRDYLSFIDINDYSDQIEFAQISKDINTYIGENVVDYDALKKSTGSIIEFYGCFTYSDDQELMITPSEITIK